MAKNQAQHCKVKEVHKDSIAEEMEIKPGDSLISINGQEIEDVFDYRYLLKDEYVEVLIKKANGEEWLLEIDKDYDEDLGVEFEEGLMSSYRSCSNKCIFCFIDQMPPGMRETLYFKDDDSRLSFLQGNYITLTNMTDRDIERIIKMHLFPINISVQTTNPELRCRMLNNRFAGEKLKYLDKLYENHVEMNGQIVLCKGVNDKEELLRSITDLKKYLPFMRSLSVVPAGLTKFRKGLYPIEEFTKEEAEEVIDLIEKVQEECFKNYGLHFVHASDEFYFLAKREFPEEGHYDGYIQLENGVGMIRLFMEEFSKEFEKRAAAINLGNTAVSTNSKERDDSKREIIGIATGQLAYPVIKECADKMEKTFCDVSIQVFPVKNLFFGESITVTGLITGGDLISQLKEFKDAGSDLGERLLISDNMLRSGEEVFLDDVKVSDVENELGLPVRIIGCGGKDFVSGILDKDYKLNRTNDGGYVYIKGFE